MKTVRSLSRVLLKTDLRDTSTIIMSFIFPLALLVVLVRAFGTMPELPGRDFVSPICVNVLGFGVAYVGIFAGALHIAQWRENGMVQVLRAFPLSTGSILLAQALVGACLALIQAILLIALAVTPWIGMELSPWAPLGIVPLALGYLTFYFLGVLLAVFVPSLAAVSMLANLIIIPLGYAGGAMMPIELLPRWVQNIAPYTPFFQMRVALSTPLIDLGTWGDAGLGCVYLLVASAILLPLAHRFFRWK